MTSRGANNVIRAEMGVWDPERTIQGNRPQSLLASYLWIRQLTRTFLLGLGYSKLALKVRAVNVRTPAALNALLEAAK